MWQFAARRRGPGRRMPRAGHPRHGRQRLVLQPDRRRADPPDARRRRHGRHRPRRPSPARRAGRTRARTSTSSASRAMSSMARPGPASMHDHLGGLPPLVDLACREEPRRDSCRPPPRRASSTRAHDLSRRRALRRPRRGRAALRRRRARLAHRAHRARWHRRDRRPLRRIAARGCSCRSPREDDVKFRGLCEGRLRARAAHRGDRRRGRRRSSCRTASPLEPRRAAPRAPRDAAGPIRRRRRRLTLAFLGLSCGSCRGRAAAVDSRP